MSKKNGANNSNKIDRRRVNKEERKNAILDAAEQLFSRKDYHDATLNEIAQAASLSKAALYLYFENKIDLFFSTIERKLLQLIEIDKRAVADSDDVVQAIKTIITREFAYFNENIDFYKVLFFQRGEFKPLAKSSNKAFRERIMPIVDRKIDVVAECIRHGQEDGVFQAIDSKDAASMLLAIVHNALFRFIATPNENANFLDKTDQVIKIFLNGLLVR